MITAITMIEDLRNNLPAIRSLVTAMSYLIGFWYVGMGLKMANDSVHDPRQPKEAIWSRMFIGAAMIAIPSMITSSVGTFFAAGSNPTALAYSGPGGANMTMAVEAIEYFIQTVGWIAIIRGLMILKRVGDGTGSSRGDTAEKGVTHILGGGMATAIVATAKAIGSTFGVSMPL